MYSSVFTILLGTSLALAVPAPTKTIELRRPKSDTKFIINFGDSYSQIGFNATIGPLPSANNILGNPPFPGFTTVNGDQENWLDRLIAVYNTSLTLAANVAVGGATTDASLVAGFEPFPSVFSFKDQVDLIFDPLLSPAPAAFPWTSENTLFSVWMGVNDVGNTWFLPNSTALAVEILDVYFDLVDNLYERGARKFLFLNVPPSYLSPFVLDMGNATVQQWKAATVVYNNILSSRVKKFKGSHHGVTTSVLDTTSSFTVPLAHPHEFGAKNSTCFSTTGTECLWFNNFHPGQAIHDQVARGAAKILGNF